MAVLQSHPRKNDRPRSVGLSAPSARGEQRQDVPYHWPRGQEAPASPTARRLHRSLILLVIVLSLASLGLLWYMIAQSTRAF
jgi:hypothetical protein